MSLNMYLEDSIRNLDVCLRKKVRDREMRGRDC